MNLDSSYHSVIYLDSELGQFLSFGYLFRYTRWFRNLTLIYWIWYLFTWIFRDCSWQSNLHIVLFGTSGNSWKSDLHIVYLELVFLEIEFTLTFDFLIKIYNMADADRNIKRQRAGLMTY